MCMDFYLLSCLNSCTFLMKMSHDIFNHNLCMILGSVQIFPLIDRVFILINIIDTSCRLRNVMRKVLLVLNN